MQKKPFIFLMFAGLFFAACTSDHTKNEEEQVIEINENLASTSVTNDKGEQLDMAFDKVKGSVEVTFNGEKVVLYSQRAASGIWYTIDGYELRGKGQEVTFWKDDVVIFTNADELYHHILFNSKGEEMLVDINNTKEVATVTWQGQTIALKQKVAASGVWYADEHYELRGKGNALELSKDGVSLFKAVEEKK